VSVPTSLNTAFDSTGQASGTRPPANEPINPINKKAPPPTGMVELMSKQIQADVGHFDLFQWLIEILTPLRLKPITFGLSVRDQIGSCFKSTPLELSVQWESNSSKTPHKTQFKTSNSRRRWCLIVQLSHRSYAAVCRS
jgi:hypothetical protein